MIPFHNARLEEVYGIASCVFFGWVLAGINKHDSSASCPTTRIIQWIEQKRDIKIFYI